MAPTKEFFGARYAPFGHGLAKSKSVQPISGFFEQGYFIA
jgi:hypothetical protein